MPSNVEPAPYDPENVFAKILRGEIPAHTVYEDEHTLAFMDVMPQGAGHTLVIPKAPARGLLDADPASLAATTATVQRVARAVKTAFSADGLTIFQYNEAAGGQTVFHLHIHIVPRFDGVALARHTGKMADSDLLGVHAAQIRAALDVA